MILPRYLFAASLLVTVALVGSKLYMQFSPLSLH